MPVVLKVWSSNPYNNGGCEFAVVELTLELAKLALRRIAVLCEQKTLDPAVYETYYWASEAEYFNPWVDIASQPEEVKVACGKLEEALESLQIDRREIVLGATELAFLESQVARVECAQMVVREDGIAFTAIPKHTDFYVTTAQIPKEVLQQSVTLTND